MEWQSYIVNNISALLLLINVCIYFYRYNDLSFSVRRFGYLLVFDLLFNIYIIIHFAIGYNPVLGQIVLKLSTIVSFFLMTYFYRAIFQRWGLFQKLIAGLVYSIFFVEVFLYLILFRLLNENQVELPFWDLTTLFYLFMPLFYALLYFYTFTEKLSDVTVKEREVVLLNLGIFFNTSGSLLFFLVVIWSYSNNQYNADFVDSIGGFNEILNIIFQLLISWAFYGGFKSKRLLLKEELKKEQEELKRLQELDHFKTRLYTNLTHEFRTPLTVILGMIDQIDLYPKKHLKEGLVIIRRNGLQLLQLINQLLDLAKLENKSFQLQLQQGDIIPYVRYLIESFESFTNSKNISLQFIALQEQLVMDYDPKQLKQIITNLMSNAIKFTPSGGQIKVKVNQEEDQLIIIVSDTGIGIPKDKIPLIFDRFYQVDNSSIREGEGTGIGLAHTLELVKLMGGNILVESQLQQGSQFSISLPVHCEPNIPMVNQDILVADISTDALLRQAPSHSEISLTNQLSSLPQVLIIEDNPDVTIYIKSCLEPAYQVETALNGQIGIEKALAQIPDLIISDVMMPKKNGYEVCDTLKQDERTSHIPIVLLTAKAMQEDKIEGFRTGADAYLIKPFDKEELLIRIGQLISIRAQLQERYARLQPVEGSDHFQKEDAFVMKLRKLVEERIDDASLGVVHLCKAANLSHMQVYRKLKALTDRTPSQFIRSIRLQKAMELLKSTDLTISEIAYDVGFTDPNYFSRTFLEEYGARPSSIRG